MIAKVVLIGEARLLANLLTDKGFTVIAIPDDYGEGTNSDVDFWLDEEKYIKIYAPAKEELEIPVKPEPYRGPVKHHKKGRPKRY